LLHRSQILEGFFHISKLEVAKPSKVTENNELCFGVVSGRGNLKGCRIAILFGFYGATEALGVEVGFIVWLIILFFLFIYFACAVYHTDSF
jgi:hypothetical protein